VGCAGATDTTDTDELAAERRDVAGTAGVGAELGGRTWIRQETAAVDTFTPGGAAVAGGADAAEGLIADLAGRAVERGTAGADTVLAGVVGGAGVAIVAGGTWGDRRDADALLADRGMAGWWGRAVGGGTAAAASPAIGVLGIAPVRTAVGPLAAGATGGTAGSSVRVLTSGQTERAGDESAKQSPAG
jgi:hypothetical protein